MNIKDLDLLCCPNCRDQLNYVFKKNSKKEIEILFCNNCKILYPIIDRIPILLKNRIRSYELEYQHILNFKNFNKSFLNSFRSNTLSVLMSVKNKAKTWEWEDEVYWGDYYSKKLGHAENEEDWGSRIWQMDWFLKNFPPSLTLNNQTILDVGCGEGHPFRYCLSKKIQTDTKYIATDISISALKFNRSLNKHKNSLYVVASVDNLPIKDQSINAIFYFGILHHAERLADTLPENADFLKSGGSILLLEALNRPFLSSYIPYYSNKIESAHEHRIDRNNLWKNLRLREDLKIINIREEYSVLYGGLRHLMKIRILRNKIFYKLIIFLDQIFLKIFSRISLFFNSSEILTILRKN